MESRTGEGQRMVMCWESGEGGEGGGVSFCYHNIIGTVY